MIYEYKQILYKVYKDFIFTIENIKIFVAFILEIA